MYSSLLQWGYTKAVKTSIFPITFTKLFIATSTHLGSEVRYSVIDENKTDNTKVIIISDSIGSHNWIAIGV